MQAESLDESITSVSGFGGLPLAMRTWGDHGNPSVILMHDFGQTHWVWEKTARSLAAAGRYVVAFDMRGHGESGRPNDGVYTLSAFVGDFAAIMDTMTDRPTVVAAASGAWIAAIAIGEGAPHAAAGLVMIGAAPWLGDESERIGQVLRQQAAGFGSIEEAAAEATRLQPRREPFELPAIQQRLRLDEDGRWRWRWDAAALSAFVMPEIQARFVTAAQRIAVPTLYIRGAESLSMTAEDLERLRALTPKSEAVEIERAGHLVVNEQTDAFNGVLLEFLERHAPCEPLFYQAGSDTRALRDALGCFATGVTVVTAASPEGLPVGLTANSFTAVSLEPPLILVCLARGSGTLAQIEQADHFAINVLHIGQQPASDRFARRTEDRFANTPHTLSDRGVPILSNSLASFECRRHASHDGGDHVVIIGQVERVSYEPRRDPLLFFRGKYRRFHFDS